MPTRSYRVSSGQALRHLDLGCLSYSARMDLAADRGFPPRSSPRTALPNMMIVDISKVPASWRPGRQRRSRRCPCTIAESAAFVAPRGADVAEDNSQGAGQRRGLAVHVMLSEIHVQPAAPVAGQPAARRVAA